MQAQIHQCQNCKSEFTIDPSDFAFYEKIQVPVPTFCPECRMQRRFAFYNMRTLYKRKDSRTGKEIFSSFSPDVPFVIYDKDYWWSDEWEALSYGQDYDFSRTFFEQFYALLKKVPLASRSIFNPVQSDYANNAGNLKDCYLVFDATECENCLYGSSMNNTKDCIDVSDVTYMEHSYETLMSTKSSNLFFSFQCDNSFDVYFSRDLAGCSNCFGCVNLRNKRYCIFNRPYSKEEYVETVKSFRISSYKHFSEMQKRVETFSLQFPVKYMSGSHNDNVSGEYISHSRNVHNSYEVTGGEDSRYCQNLIPPFKDCYDYYTWGLNAELIYECCDSGRGVSNLKFCYDCFGSCKELAYCIQCSASSNLFGCVGLRKKQYCILNKQYAKKEYEKLVAKIIAQMEDMPYIDKKERKYRYGEFFPIEFSPFAYNTTAAQEFFPLLQDEVQEKGYFWENPRERNYFITLYADQLPDDIGDATDDILNQTIECQHKGICNEQCTQAFRIIAQEFKFYMSQGFPLPRLCPNCRYFQRTKKRNPFRSWQRTCHCAGKVSQNSIYQNQASHFHRTSPCPHEFETSFAPERAEIVYCKECYQGTVAKLSLKSDTTDRVGGLMSRVASKAMNL